MLSRYLKMLYRQLVIESKLFLRDRSSVFWSYFFPVFLILLFGFVFNKPDSIRVGVAFVDHDRTDASNRIFLDLGKIPVLDLEPMADAEMREALKNSKKSFAIVINDGYEQRLKSGNSVTIEVLYNPEQQQVMQIVTPILQQIIDQTNWKMVNREPPIQIVATPVQPLKEDFSYISFLVPGLIGFSLMATCLFSIGVVVVSYREKGKLRRLAVTPLPKSIFIAGQILTRYLIVLTQAILLIGIAVFLFDVRIVGSIFQFFLALTIGMFAFIALGYAIASIAKTPETAAGIANTLFLPMTFLSGVYFSADGLPGFLQPLVALLPLTHLVHAIRGIFSNGQSIFEFLPQMGILIAWMIVCFTFAVRKFKWE